MNKICTSLEQSQKLIELGIDVDTADMIHNILGESYVRHDTPIDKYHTPAWSLTALLEQLPCVICDDEGNSANLSIYKENDNYQLVYNSNFCEDFDDIEIDFHENFADTCVDMIERLHELNLL